MIGNAVPPLVSEAVGDATMKFLNDVDDMKAIPKPSYDAVFIPKNKTEAVKRLTAVSRLSEKELRALSSENFLKTWHALIWLFPGLHPDSAHDHGKETEAWPEAETRFPGIPLEYHKYHSRSGWPVPFVTLGGDAWRRYDSREITDDSFYCADAQRAGILFHQCKNSACSCENE